MNKDLRSGLLLVGTLAMIGAVAVTAWRVAYAPQTSVVATPVTSDPIMVDALPAPAELPTPDDMAIEPTPAPDACFVGGCSNQVCTDDPDIMTTCEWQEAYACYAQATCERQSSGECGWTETPELAACLVSAETAVEPVMVSE